MIETYIDVWRFHDPIKYPNNYIGVTTNGVVIDGKCVMGGGIARQARDKFKGIDKLLGTLINNFGNEVFILKKEKIFSFPTKTHFKFDSDLKLMEKSCEKLLEYILASDSKRIFYLVRPGVGLGNLDWETQVKPLLLKYFSDQDRLVIVEFSK